VPNSAPQLPQLYSPIFTLSLLLKLLSFQKSTTIIKRKQSNASFSLTGSEVQKISATSINSLVPIDSQSKVEMGIVG
jgi:hypothetical protein